MNADRRSFFKSSIHLVQTLAMANTGVYLLGAISKSLDGSLVAGAKCTKSGSCVQPCGWVMGEPSGKCGTWTCSGGVDVCDTGSNVCVVGAPCF